MGLIKSQQQISLLREAGRRLTAIFDKVANLVKAGAVPVVLDRNIAALIAQEQGVPSFLGYQGYPAASCIAVNEQVVHAIPNRIPFKNGDVVTVDIGFKYRQVYVDAARSYAVGRLTPEADRLLKVTKEALLAGVNQVRPGNRVGQISHAIGAVATRAGLGIVRSLTGHGVGSAVHEEPSIPNFGRRSDGLLLKAGMVLAIEPMLTAGGGEVETKEDGWTVVTADGSIAVQWEHTVLVTDNGREILV